MMKTIFACLVCFVCFVPVAQAQAPLVFPAGTTLTVNGTQYKAFTLEEYKAVATIYVDYVNLFNKVPLLEERLKLRLDMEENYKDQVSNCEHMLGEYKTNGEYWKARFEDSVKLASKDDFRDKLEKIGLWAVIVIETGYIMAISIRGLATQ